MVTSKTKAGLTSLHALGKKTQYPADYAPEVLESFANRHPDHDYFVKFNCPEFTALCPITGQPDFATIYIAYVPDKKLVESKSSNSICSASEITETSTKTASMSSWKTCVNF
jgi:7-cyano-7-deazaguanine reductase